MPPVAAAHHEWIGNLNQSNSLLSNLPFTFGSANNLSVFHFLVYIGFPSSYSLETPLGEIIQNLRSYNLISFSIF